MRLASSKRLWVCDIMESDTDSNPPDGGSYGEGAVVGCVPGLAAVGKAIAIGIIIHGATRQIAVIGGAAKNSGWGACRSR